MGSGGSKQKDPPSKDPRSNGHNREIRKVSPPHPIVSSHTSTPSVPRSAKISSVIIEDDPSIIVDTSRESFLRALVRYYNIMVTKVEDVNVDGKILSKYMASVPCMTINQFKYIIVICNKFHKIPIGKRIPLTSIIRDMASFQTRTAVKEAKNHFILNTVSVTGGMEKDSPLVDIIDIADSNKDESVYISSRYPVEVHLFHKGKKENEFSDKLTIIAALESFNCSIQMNI